MPCMSLVSRLHFGAFKQSPLWFLPSETNGFIPTCARVAPLLATRFLRLQQVGAHSRAVPRLPQSALGIHTPLRVDVWSDSLLHHPNREWVSGLLTGLWEGVHIGFDRTTLHKSARANMQSASDHPEVVQQYLDNELQSGNLAGPFLPSQVDDVTINRFGVIPKHHKPGKWRLIVDLSYPQGFSINDGISSADSSMVYSSLDDAARLIAIHSRNAILAKIDISSAFRIIPVHPQDRPLLGMCWNNNIYIDKQLPFGLRSAPIIFNAYADALEWILKDHGCRYIIHYLDDFLVIGPPNSLECQTGLNTMLSICKSLGVPLADEKIEGPSTCLSFLGIELDSTTMQARLPQDKLTRLRQELATWQVKKSCTRKELEHLVGVLQFACKVVPQGRPFVRRMINLLCVPKEPYHHVRLNKEFRSDLLWWYSFVHIWNGISLLRLTNGLIPSANIFTDASGNFGCGAVWGLQWIQGMWPVEWHHVNIMTKEMVPVVLACATWGRQWSGKHIHLHIDNMAVVEVLKKGSSKEPSGIVMHLLRCLSFGSAIFQFTYSAFHIPGVCNSLADDISRNQLSSLPPQKVTVSPDLWSLLVQDRPDWTSPEWRRLFTNSIHRV